MKRKNKFQRVKEKKKTVNKLRTSERKNIMGGKAEMWL